MDTGREIEFNRMIELLDRKKQLLGDMLELTKAQTDVIAEGTLDKLKQLVDEKQSKIDQIDKLDADFGVYFESLKAACKINKLSELDVSAYPGAKRLKQITSEVIGLVGEISGVEKVNSEKSKKLLDELGSQIRKVNQGKKINNAYARKPNTPASLFLDQKK
jgi:5'-3' exonuclease